MSSFGDRACFASAARGAGVALRDAGWEVRIDLRRVTGDPQGEHPVRHLPPIELEHLRWFRNPLVVAACVLANLELLRAEALNVRLGDLAPDGSAIRLRRGAVGVPAVARPMLRAQRLARQRQGAQDTDYLLADRWRPMSAAAFTSTVLSLLEEIGTSLPRAAIDVLPSEDERWLAEAGITFEWIIRRDRPRREVGGWHPDALAREVLVALRAELRAPSRSACACEERHVAPAPDAAPSWPYRRNHATPPETHPWRRGAFVRSAGR